MTVDQLDQLADAWRNLMVGIGHPGYQQTVTGWTCEESASAGALDPDGWIDPGELSNEAKNFLAAEKLKMAATPTKFRFQCAHRQCPERPPIPADHPPACYTCGERMRALI